MADLAPPGFRFYPTEEELVSFYLQNKLRQQREDLNRVMDRVIPVLDIYEFSPWELPQQAGELCHGDPEQCFFFIPRQESEARGGRPRRLTTTGYWKATGSPGYVYSSANRVIGMKRTMVFYNGRAPLGIKTEWKMNEYMAIEGEASSSNAPNNIPRLRKEFSLCRVYKKLKCLRAFDRRPRLQQIYPNDVSASSHQNKSETKDQAGSSDSSSSNDHGAQPSQPQQIGESSNMEMEIENNEMQWVLDQLNWID